MGLEQSVRGIYIHRAGQYYAALQAIANTQQNIHGRQRKVTPPLEKTEMFYI